MKIKNLAILGLSTVLCINVFSLPASPAQGKKFIPGKFISGTCKQLFDKGIYNIPKNNPNYRPSRDRNGNGIACELSERPKTFTRGKFA
jgi:Excalibur calcium-binding domain